MSHHQPQPWTHKCRVWGHEIRLAAGADCEFCGQAAPDPNFCAHCGAQRGYPHTRDCPLARGEP